ncbi:MAG: GNAT family N-acetyltransferase [Saccharofermentanales bacterium]|jgi:ribosomal protein S18 acetylase RimI-like enzyme
MADGISTASVELLRLTSLQHEDVPKLMAIYRESDRYNANVLFPHLDPAEAYRRAETRLVEFLNERFFTAPGRVLAVLVQDDEWICALRYTVLDDQWFIEGVETRPDRRRERAATRMFQKLIETIDHPTELRLFVPKTNNRSLCFHRSLGFEIVATSPVHPVLGTVSEGRYDMRLRIDPENMSI